MELRMMCALVRLSRIYIRELSFVLLVLCTIQPAAADEKVLHVFSSQPQGGSPFGLVADSSGNLFGTTQKGGAYNYGAVYEFAPNADGGWTQTVLHSFSGGADGGGPLLPVLDSEGNLYGATSYGGSGCGGGCGTVFKLTPNSSGGWVESVIYNFQASDGYPTGALIQDGLAIFLEQSLTIPREVSPCSS